MSMVEVMPEETIQGLRSVGSWEAASPLHKRLAGKVAIVTGGARGIGEATVRLFVRHGAKVTIADVDASAGELLAASLSPSVTFCHCDVTQESNIKHLVDSTLSRYGRLDIMFNNAGILGSQVEHRRSITSFDADEFDRVTSVNVRGVALGMKYAARAMIPRRSGCIISTASVAGVVGGCGPHGYTATKHAIVGLTKNVACELGAYGIRVNCISPFGVATSMLVRAWSAEHEEEAKADLMGLRNPRLEEAERMEETVKNMANLRGPTLRAKDIAEAALYLASAESNYVSGHNLVVDGGVTVARNCVGL